MTLPSLSHELPPSALHVLSRAEAFETIHGGTRMVWHAWGAPVSEPLLLLHGGSGSWTHWLRNVEPIAASGRRVLVPDLPGFGDSVAAEDVMDVDDMVEPLFAGLRQMLDGRGVDVVGFSFGGMLAGFIAAAHPELMRRLVLVGAPALGPVEMRLRDWRHLGDVGERDQVHRENLQALMLQDPSSIDDLAVRLHAANLARDRVRRRRISRTNALARLLPTLSGPVYGIWGECDQLLAGRMGELGEAMRRVPRFGELVLIPHAGHWVQFESAKRFNRELIRLLTSPL